MVRERVLKRINMNEALDIVLSKNSTMDEFHEYAASILLDAILLNGTIYVKLGQVIASLNNFLLFLPTTVKKAPSFINAFTADFPMPDVPPTTIIFFFSNNINILLPA